MNEQIFTPQFRAFLVTKIKEVQHDTHPIISTSRLSNRQLLPHLQGGNQMITWEASNHGTNTRTTQPKTPTRKH